MILYQIHVANKIRAAKTTKSQYLSNLIHPSSSLRSITDVYGHTLMSFKFTGNSMLMTSDICYDEGSSVLIGRRNVLLDIIDTIVGYIQSCYVVLVYQRTWYINK